MHLNLFKYKKEELDPNEDCGTMPGNVEELSDAVIGHKIVSAEHTTGKDRWGGSTSVFAITLDNGAVVQLFDTNDCCAYTSLENFLLHPESVNHVIIGVATTEQYQTWHIYADFGDVMTLDVGWSCGNPFYYGYGFDIKVVNNSFT